MGSSSSKGTGAPAQNTSAASGEHADKRPQPSTGPEPLEFVPHETDAGGPSVTWRDEGGRAMRQSALSPVRERPEAGQEESVNNPAIPTLAIPRKTTSFLAMRAASHDFTRKPPTLSITPPNANIPDAPTDLRSDLLGRRFSAPLPIATGRDPQSGQGAFSYDERTDDFSRPESQRRAGRLMAHSGLCSQILDYLFVSGEMVAQDRAILAKFGITHVVNCAGLHVPNHFESATEHGPPLNYLKLNMYDSKTDEDVTWFLYDVIQAIEKARAQGGRILVHCIQGVSRSCAMAIAYLVWRDSLEYRESFNRVRAARPICSPNIAFIVNLMEWAKRRQHWGSHLYRMAPHGEHDPATFVPKFCHSPQEYSATVRPTAQTLDPRTTFVVVIENTDTPNKPGTVFLWRGARATVESVERAKHFASILSELEGAIVSSLEPIRQDAEPEEFWAAIGGKGPVNEVEHYKDLLWIGQRPRSTSRTPPCGEIVPPPPDPLSPALPPPPPQSAAAAAPDDEETDEFDNPFCFVHVNEGGNEVWQQIPEFGEMDLTSDALLFLYVPKGLAEEKQLTKRHYIWAGREKRGDFKENALEHLKQLLTQPGLEAVAHDMPTWQKSNIIYEGLETDEFWLAFESDFVEEEDDEEEEDDLDEEPGY